MKKWKTTEQKYRDAVNSNGVCLYDVKRSRKDKRNHTGFQYKGQLFRRTTSPILYAEGTRNRRILDYFDGIIFQLIENVKSIKTFYNYTVPKDHKHIN